jgi:hypothetical protein
MLDMIWDEQELLNKLMRFDLFIIIIGYSVLNTKPYDDAQREHVPEAKEYLSPL